MSQTITPPTSPLSERAVTDARTVDVLARADPLRSWVATALQATAIVAFAACFARSERVSMLKDIQRHPLTVSTSGLRSTDAVATSLGRGFIAAVVLTAVLFIVWEVRLVKALRAEDRSVTTSPVLAGVSWFIPLANYVLPFKIVYDLLPRRTSARVLAGFWWALTVLGVLLPALTRRNTGSALARAQHSDSRYVAMLILLAISGTLAAATVRRVRAPRGDRAT